VAKKRSKERRGGDAAAGVFLQKDLATHVIPWQKAEVRSGLERTTGMSGTRKRGCFLVQKV